MSALHYAAPYLAHANGHPLTVLVIGAGGTGSQVIRLLGQMHTALLALGKPGLHVRLYDGDTVDTPNVGRQNFTLSDIGYNKAALLIARANAFFGVGWEAMPVAFDLEMLSRYSRSHGKEGSDFRPANLVLTCVDRADFRVGLHYQLLAYTYPFSWLGDMERPYYWLDFGNSRYSGQAVLGTVASVQQPASDYPTNGFLPNVTDLFADLLDGDMDLEPSCSMAEALHRQGLFINGEVALKGMDLLWTLLLEGRIAYHAAYVNQRRGTTLAPVQTPQPVVTRYELVSCRPVPGEVEFATAKEAKARAEEVIRAGFNFTLRVVSKERPFRYGKAIKVYRKSTFKKLRGNAHEESPVRHTAHHAPACAT
jgi:PRTRC genetic system ThiF family protein